MHPLLRTFARLRALFRRRSRDAEMSAELQAHIDALTDRNIAGGMSPEEARYAALREFGGVEQIKERCRDESKRGFIWLEQTAQDFRHAVRALLRHRGFTTVAVLTLALGIGVNCVLFTFFDVMTLRPLPIKDAQRMYDVRRQNDLGWNVPGFSYPEYLELRHATHGFDGFAAWMDIEMTVDQRNERPTSFVIQRSLDVPALPIQFVSENYFSLLGGDVVLGRGFRREETAASAESPVIVLSHRFWTEQYASDPNVLGKTITLNDTAYTIIGVTAPEFTGKLLAPPAGWIPVGMLDPKLLADPMNTRFLVFAKIRAGVRVGDAYPELQVIVERLAAQATGTRRLTRARLMPTGTFLPMPLNWKTAGILAPIWMSFLAVLLIAAANVANLLLARATIRQHEIGVRLALGATRGRVVRHLLMESAVIAVMGGAAGLVLTNSLLHLLRPHVVALLPPDPVMRGWLYVNLTPDYRVVLVTFSLVLLAAMVAGLMPALLSARADVTKSLKHGGAALSASSQPRRVLVIAQIAICLTLLGGAGVLVRHMIGYANVETGLQTANVYPANFKVLPSNLHLLPPEVRKQMLRDAGTPTARQEALRLARSLPGISALAQASVGPFWGRLRYTAVRSTAEPGQDDFARFNVVTPDFFGLFGLSARRGRVFSTHEADTHARVAVINESAAQQFFPHRNALGQQLEVADLALGGGWSSPLQARAEPATTYTSYEIVGVVADTRTDRVAESDGPVVYLPQAGDDVKSGTTFVKLTASRDELAPTLRDAAAAVGLSLELMDSLDDARKLRLLPLTATAWIGSCLAALAVALAMVGLYGVMAFMVNQRTREIGIRISLGATTERVVSLFVRQGLRLVVVGVAVGAVGGLLVPLSLPKAIVGIDPIEPLSLIAVIILLFAAALIACWLPARRAAKVDPICALRTE